MKLLKETATIALVLQFVMVHLIAIQLPLVRKQGNNSTTAAEVDQLIEGIVKDCIESFPKQIVMVQLWFLFLIK